MGGKDQAIASKLASVAVGLGTSIRCRSLFAEGGGPGGRRYNVTADRDLVVVRRVPDDLPFMEHPAWDSEVETLLRVKTKSLRQDFAKEHVEVEHAVTAFMKNSNCGWLSIALEDGGLLHATASHASIAVRARHRFLPWHYLKPVSGWSIA